MKPRKLRFRDRLQSLQCAFKGVGIVVKTQHNAVIHLVCTVLALGLSYWLQIGRVKFAVIVLAIGMVWAAEALNTTCEILVNMVSPRYSARAGRAKDVGAAAVLMASIGALVVGLLILGPPLWQMLK